MARIKAIVATLFVLSFTSISCTQEFNEVNARLDNLEQRVSALETIVKASENGDVIISVNPIQDKEVLIGYHIEFQKESPIDVFFGKDGRDGDSMFKSVIVTDTEVTFVTTDGQTFVIRKATALSIGFDSADLVVMGTNSTRDIHYTITSEIDDIAIEALSSADIKVKVVKADAKTGTLNVKTGVTIDEYSKVVVLVNNGSQAIMRTLSFEAEEITVKESTTKTVSDEGGEVALEFFSNVPCHAEIPVAAQSWISVTPEAKAIEKQTICLIVQPNTGAARSTTVVVQSEDGSLVLPFIIEQQKKPGKKASLPTVLPYWVDKATITHINFYVNSEKETETKIGNATDKYEPIYFEQNGTVVNYYTKGEAYELNSCARAFSGWKSLKSLDLSTVNTANAISMEGMFSHCMALESIDLTGFNTSSVTNMEGMFAECRQLKNIVIGDIITDKVKSMSDMFSHCMALESIDLSGFNTSSVTNMAGMFAGCSSLKTLDVSTFDTSNVEDMSHMFGPPNFESPIDASGADACCSLTELDLSGFKTAKVKLFSEMFAGCVSLERLNLSGWDTHNAEYIHQMFGNCASLRHLDLSTFDTRKVVGAIYLFKNCTALEELNLSNFYTPHLEYAQNMFAGCYSLRKLDISHFSSERLSSAPLMFSGCQRLTSLDLGDCDYSTISDTNSFLNAVGNKSGAVAIRCNEKTRSFIEDKYYDPRFDLKKVTWISLNESLPDMPDQLDPELYCSTDYSKDKQVRVYQTATVGKGVDVVLLGDAYSDRLIADGTYDNDMNIAIDGLFSYEPMKSFKDYFNIYVVYAVSKNESYLSDTALGVPNVAFIDCQKYIKRAVSDKPMSDIASIIIAHDPRAFKKTNPGFTVSSFAYSDEDRIDYGQSQISLAFIARIDNDEPFKGTVVHEFGHLFAKLWDEYTMYDEVIPDSEIEIMNKLYYHLGVGKNIDLTNDLCEIKWKRFVSDPRYENERIGAYEGGYAYSQGAWRPTEESIMRTSGLKHGFNAPSREAIYNRIHKLAFGKDWQYDYESFVQQDLKNIPSAQQAQSSPHLAPQKSQANQQHLFKMEESIAPDGRKMVTVIMD